MRKTGLTIALAALVATSAPALADVRINARLIDLQRQVDAGKRSGKLSLRERRMLTNEIRAHRRTVERYENSYGRFTPREKVLVRADLDRTQARITRMKDNRERGPDSVPF
jgi:hypothetical protein